MYLAELLSNRLSDDEPAMPQPDAAAETLKERLVEYLRKRTFEVGDLVICKVGLDERREDHAPLPMIVLSNDVSGWISAPPEHGSPSTRADIVLLSLSRDGTARPRLWNSHVLESWPRPF